MVQRRVKIIEDQMKDAVKDAQNEADHQWMGLVYNAVPPEDRAKPCFFKDRCFTQLYCEKTEIKRMSAWDQGHFNDVKNDLKEKITSTIPKFYKNEQLVKNYSSEMKKKDYEIDELKRDKQDRQG